MFWSKIEKYQYVSFDIFDTLLVRITGDSTTVFEIMEANANKYGVCLPIDFVNKRRNAELKAIKKNIYADIFDIYEELDGIRHSNQVELAKYEMQIESYLCIGNREIKILYDRCIDAGKDVVITSDMYLPKPFLAELLEKCGIGGYKKLYVSQFEKVDKRHGGRIYKHILKDLNICAREIIHVGDDFISDILMAKKNGVNTLHYKRDKRKWNKLTKDGLNYLEKCDVNSKLKKAYILQQNVCFEIMSANKIEKVMGTAREFGFSCMGPLLQGFSFWLKESFRHDGIEKVFFLSRDGCIMEKAFSIIDKEMPHQYLYASRRALIVPTLWKHPEWDDTLGLLSIDSFTTTETVLSYLGLNPNKYDKSLKKHGLRGNDILTWTDLQSEKFKFFYEDIKLDVIKNSKEQFSLLKKYLLQNSFNGRVAIVDIGWNGRMQRSLIEVASSLNLDVTIVGYYLGISPYTKIIKENNLEAHGWLFEPGRKKLYWYASSMTAVIEFVFSAFHGTVLGYHEENGKITPIFGSYEYDIFREKDEKKILIDEPNFLKIIQNYGLKYMKIINKNYDFVNYSFSKKNVTLINMGYICFLNFILLERKHYKWATKLFGDLRICGDDGHLNYMAKPKNIIKYLIHPKKFMLDFRAAFWKTGFLARMLNISLPYTFLYRRIRELWLRFTS